MQQNSITTEWKCTAQTHYDKSQRKLDLTHQKVDCFAIQSIFGACKWIANDVQVLNLSQNRIGPRGVKWLGNADFKNVLELDLSLTQIGSEGVKYLEGSSFPNLQQLWLTQNRIGCEGSMHLVTGCFNKLTKLFLHSNQIGPEGVKHLLTDNFRNLRKLWLSWNNNIEEPNKTKLESLFSLSGQVQLYLKPNQAFQNIYGFLNPRFTQALSGQKAKNSATISILYSVYRLSIGLSEDLSALSSLSKLLPKYKGLIMPIPLFWSSRDYSKFFLSISH